MYRLLKPALFLLFSCFFIPVSAKDRAVDSLYAALKSQTKEDSNKVNTILSLTVALLRVGNTDTALPLANSALDLATKLNYKQGMAEAYRTLGTIYKRHNLYSKAVESQSKAFDISSEMKDKPGMCASLTNICVIYWMQGDFAKSLDYGFKALAIARTTHDKVSEAKALLCVGNVYAMQQDYKNALSNFLQALDIQKTTNDKHSMCNNLINIGNVYALQGNHRLAISTDSTALALSEELNDEDLISSCIGNMATFYGEMGQQGKALEYVFKAMELNRKYKDVENIALNQCEAGRLFMETKDYKRAQSYFDSSLSNARSIGATDATRYAYQGLAELDVSTNNYIDAFKNYKLFIQYSDSLQNEENTKKTVEAQMNFEFEQKQAAVKAEQDKKDALSSEELKKQKIVIFSVSFGLILVLLLAITIYRSLQQNRKKTKVIVEQKAEVEKKNGEIELQKALVEEKNKEIIDSITYAKRLQDAILPPLNVIKQHLPDSFVLYKPKDIVAGDFYWMMEGAATLFIAACDCTGHGVPGAMVSVVCSNALNQAVKEFGISEPGKILDKTRELVLETFEKSEGDIKDGMDISLASLSPSEGGIEVKWSGAYNSLWYIEKGELKEISGDKQPIGKHDNAKPFITHTFAISPQRGDKGGPAACLYLFTDGYADQFGGDKGKKFKYKQLQQLITDNSHLPMEEQKQILEKAFETWKGNLEQVDDVLIIGIRV